MITNDSEMKQLEQIMVLMRKHGAISVSLGTCTVTLGPAPTQSEAPKEPPQDPRENLLGADGLTKAEQEELYGRSYNDPEPSGA